MHKATRVKVDTAMPSGLTSGAGRLLASRRRCPGNPACFLPTEWLCRCPGLPGNPGCDTTMWRALSMLQSRERGGDVGSIAEGYM